jgi:hypothetical protein
MDNLQYRLTEAYNKMMKESDYDYYYREITNPNLFNNVGIVPILKKEIQRSALDNESKVSLLLKLKAQAERIGVPFDEAADDFGNRDMEYDPRAEHEEQHKTMTQLYGHPRGNNADWGVSAWLIKGKFPFGIWMVDDSETGAGDGQWALINRGIARNAAGVETGEYDDQEILSGDFETVLNKAQELGK